MDIDYKLAKRLKDVGFPQHVVGQNLFYNKQGRAESVGDAECPKDCILIPTLSGLIDACGDEFMELRKMEIRLRDGCNWYARTFVNRGDINVIGRNPLETMSELFIALKNNGTHN